MAGGYDEGYSACSCFWGQAPGSLVVRLESLLGSFEGAYVLDAGCGEGKNAVHFARKGARVLAIDVSDLAIRNAKNFWEDLESVDWRVCDIRDTSLRLDGFDIVIAYGLLHCLGSPGEVAEVVDILRKATKKGGYNVVCTFNDRWQDLSAHPNFCPTLISHSNYMRFYKDWAILYSSDTDLYEVHPHNSIPHTHSLTRMIARK